MRLHSVGLHLRASGLIKSLGSDSIESQVLHMTTRDLDPIWISVLLRVFLVADARKVLVYRSFGLHSSRWSAQVLGLPALAVGPQFFGLL